MNVLVIGEVVDETFEMTQPHFPKRQWRKAVVDRKQAIRVLAIRLIQLPFVRRDLRPPGALSRPN
jgi:hypothetical protein